MKVSQRTEFHFGVKHSLVIFYTKKMACVIKNEMPILDKPQQFKIFESIELREGALFQ